MRIALVHDFLVNRGGAERVALALHRTFPDAPIYTALFRPGDTFPGFADAAIRVSRLQRLARPAGDFRRLLPLFGRAFRAMRIEADVVVASTAAFAHHVRPAGAFVAYCHTPPRFLWDERYRPGAVAPSWARPLLPPALASLRRADLRAAARVDTYVANGARTAAAIEQLYRRSATIVHPPVDTDRFTPSPPSGEHWVMVGRLLPHRNHHLAVQAFTATRRQLVVVGDGPERRALERIAGPSVRFEGVVDDAELAGIYAGARGVVVPGEEDLGIVALEANACARPVVALGAGGALETVQEGRTGVLFRDETPRALAAAVARAEELSFDPEVLRANALRFSLDVFTERIRALVEKEAR